MEENNSTLDALTESGRRLAVQIERDIAAADEVTLTWTEALLRNRLTRQQQVLRARTKECLDYELQAADLLQNTAHHGGSGSADGPWPPFATTEALGVYAQRDTLRMLLATLSASIADIKQRCESRITNAINFLLLFLTLSSIAVAIISYRVAKVTYDDAVSSGQQQQASMKKQVAALEGSSRTLQAVDEESKKQQALLEDITKSAHAQADYLASEQAAERRRRDVELLRANANRMHEAAEILIAYYQSLDSDSQALIKLLEIERATISIPFNQQERDSIDEVRQRVARRVELAEAVSRWSKFLSDTGQSGDIEIFADPSLIAASHSSAKDAQPLRDTPEAVFAMLRTETRNSQPTSLQNIAGSMQEFFEKEIEFNMHLHERCAVIAESVATQQAFLRQQPGGGHSDTGDLGDDALAHFGIKLPDALQSSPQGSQAVQSQIHETTLEQNKLFDLKTKAINNTWKLLHESFRLRNASTH